MKFLFIVLYCLAAIMFIPLDAKAQEGAVQMKITSPEFLDNQSIPSKFTCEGEDINPRLDIEGLPQGTKSLVLIVEDPDAAIGVWVHWVVFDIPVAGTIDEDSIPGKQGLNTAWQNNYHGPCPPSGTHRYFFKVFALDTLLYLDEKTTKGALEKAIKGHVLAEAQIVGLYKKSK